MEYERPNVAELLLRAIFIDNDNQKQKLFKILSFSIKLQLII